MNEMAAGASIMAGAILLLFVILGELDKLYEKWKAGKLARGRTKIERFRYR